MCRSALRVLRSLTGLLQTVLLALDGARVTREVAGLLQRRPVLGLDDDQRPGDGQTQRARLSGRSATVEVREDVDAFDPVDEHQRSLDQLLVHLVREVLLEAAAVQVELAGAWRQA